LHASQSDSLDPDVRSHTRAPVLAVGAVIVERLEPFRVALIRRGRAPALGQWSIPGGHIEPNERDQDAAEREAFEETGLRVQATELLCEVTLGRYVIREWLCALCGSPHDLRAGDDAIEARWVSLEQAAALGVSPAALEVLQLGVDRVRRSCEEG
jgi:ADP-ribose pyrophosphatase YjhB (NUDIX family)